MRVSQKVEDMKIAPVYQAIKRRDGRWFAGMVTLGEGIAIGYCIPYKPFSEESFEATAKEMADLFGVVISAKEKEEIIRHNRRCSEYKRRFHNEGHASKEEAEACLKLYQSEVERGN